MLPSGNAVNVGQNYPPEDSGLLDSCFWPVHWPLNENELNGTYLKLNNQMYPFIRFILILCFLKPHKYVLVYQPNVSQGYVWHVVWPGQMCPQDMFGEVYINCSLSSKKLSQYFIFYFLKLYNFLLRDFHINKHIYSSNLILSWILLLRFSDCRLQFM